MNDKVIQIWIISISIIVSAIILSSGMLMLGYSIEKSSDKLSMGIMKGGANSKPSHVHIPSKLTLGLEGGATTRYKNVDGKTVTTKELGLPIRVKVEE